MNIEQIFDAVMILFLAILAYQDIRTGMMNVIVIGICGASGLAVRLISGSGLKDILPGTAVGLAVLILAYVSRQAVGYGDGLVLTASGLYLGLTDNIILLLVSMILCAVTSVILIISGIKKTKDRIPFAPFMLAGYVLMIGVY